MENAEYIDTVRGKLPLAEAAKMIAQDRSKQDELFTEAHISKVRKQCYRKLICVGFSFACLFSTFFCLRNLQSSNSGDDPILGLITFGCLTCLTWFGVLAAASVIYYLRPKWCLVIASVPCMLYTAANFYPSKATLIPAALLSGLGIGMLWSSEGIYMINLAATYALVSKKPMIEVIGKFNGVVFTMYQSSHLIGNLLSSLILGDMIEWFPKTHSATDVDIAAAVSNGTSELPIKLTTQACGLNFALSSQVVNRFNQVDPRQNIILLSVLMAIAFLGFLNLVLLLKPLNTVKASVSSSLLQNLRSFVKMFADVKSWLLVPFMMYPGISGSIAMADYTKAFITCAYGVGYIGYILMAGAVFSFLGALISGRIIHRTGRIPVFLFATLSTLVSLCMMLLWQPRSDHFDFKAFIPVCLWCLSDGIILTQINGFLGEIFRKELTYALCMLHLCYGIGASFGTLSSAYSWLSLSHKLYFTIAEVMLAFVLFLILEVLIKKNKV